MSTLSNRAASIQAARAVPTTTTRYDLAESTVESLHAPELLALAGDLSALSLDYGDPAGNAALRAAVGAASGVAAGAVLTVPGTMLGLLLLAEELCRGAGEAVLVTPCFGPARSTLARVGATIRQVALDFETAYALDVGRLLAAVGPRTRLVCLANPQNPSGLRVPEAALRAVLEGMRAAAPAAMLCLDETYREATYGAAPVPPSAAALDRRVATLGSLSKAHGAPGLRVGWLTVTEPSLHRKLVAAKLDLLISGSVLDEALAAAILRAPEAVLRPRQRALQAALGQVRTWHAMREAERIDMLWPDAGALCCGRLATSRLDDDAVRRFWDAMPAAGLQLAPGRWFAETDRVFRLGFGHLPADALPGALAALSRALDEAEASR